MGYRVVISQGMNTSVENMHSFRNAEDTVAGTSLTGTERGGGNHPGFAPHTKIKPFGFCSRTSNALNRAGIVTVSELLEESRNSLLARDGIGMATIREIELRLLKLVSTPILFAHFLSE